MATDARVTDADREAAREFLCHLNVNPDDIWANLRGAVALREALAEFAARVREEERAQAYEDAIEALNESANPGIISPYWGYVMTWYWFDMTELARRFKPEEADEAAQKAKEFHERAKAARKSYEAGLRREGAAMERAACIKAVEAQRLPDGYDVYEPINNGREAALDDALAALRGRGEERG